MQMITKVMSVYPVNSIQRSDYRQTKEELKKKDQGRFKKVLAKILEDKKK